MSIPLSAPAPHVGPVGLDAPFIADALSVPLLPILAFAGILAPPLLTLYRRITRRDLLRQEQRGAVLDYFRANPGATAAKATAALGVDYKTIIYHARILEEFRLLRKVREGRSVRYHAVPAAPRAVVASG